MDSNKATINTSDYFLRVDSCEKNCSSDKRRSTEIWCHPVSPSPTEFSSHSTSTRPCPRGRIAGQFPRRGPRSLGDWKASTDRRRCGSHGGPRRYRSRSLSTAAALPTAQRPLSGPGLRKCFQETTSELRVRGGRGRLEVVPAGSGASRPGISALWCAGAAAAGGRVFGMEHIRTTKVGARRAARRWAV